MNVVLALSGGSAKAAAHVGVVQALSEHGHVPAHYVGTSMGAVVAACFAAGLTYQEMLVRMVGIRRKDVAVPAARAALGFFGTSFLRGGPLKETIARLVPAHRFKDLEYPLTVTAVDRATGELVLFGAGGREHTPLVDALCASCALPVYYPPVTIVGREYMDGGLRSVIPLDVASTFAPDLLVGSYVGPVFYADIGGKAPPMPALMRVASDVLRITMAAQAEDEMARWTDRAVLVRPQMTSDASFAVARVAEFVAEGYRAAMRALG
ncbi:MAG: patatin-like phospholipase family protein [Gemmatimonadales bacterium]